MVCTVFKQALVAVRENKRKDTVDCGYLNFLGWRFESIPDTVHLGNALAI